jgi:hypothetical protein
VKEAIQAFVSVYPNTQAYASKCEAVMDAMEEVEQKAWDNRVRMGELAAYMREGVAAPAWWAEYSGGVGGRDVAGQEQGKEEGKGKGKWKQKWKQRAS